MAEEEIIDLREQTIEQSSSAKWFEARRKRLTASKNLHSIKSKKSKSIESLVNDILHPKKVSCSSMNYGKKYEPEARKYYEETCNMQVKEMGALVSSSQHWICVSLDGVVVKDACVVKIIEIKCPSSCEKKAIVDYENQRCNVNYLQIINGTLTLKKSSQIYTQCQVQMYVSGQHTCDLLVYTPIQNRSEIISVHRDEKFLENVIPIAEEFYFKNFLPKLFFEFKKHEIG